MLVKLVFLSLILGLMVPQNFVNADKTPLPAIHLDKESYSLYSRVSISIFEPEADKDPLTAEKIYIDVETKEAKLKDYILTEIGSRSGNFSGHIVLTGPDGLSEGKGPFDGKMRADRGDVLIVSFFSKSEKLITAHVPIDYHIGQLFFDRSSYSEADSFRGNIRVIVVDEDLNLDAEQRDLPNQSGLEAMLLLSGQEGDKLYFANVNYIYLFETDVNSGIFVGYIRNGECDRCVGLKEKGDTLPFFYHDLTLPKPYDLTKEGGQNGIWIFAIAQYLGKSTSPVPDPAYLFLDDWHNNRDFIVKTESAIRDMKFLKYDNKLEFINAADKLGTIEMQIPKAMFKKIDLVRINHTKADYNIRTDANYFKIQIKYPAGTNYVEILDLDIANPIILGEPELVSELSGGPRMIVGEEIIVQSLLENKGEHDHPFFYIMQVKDNNGTTMIIDSVDSLIRAGESLRAAVKWVPESKGNYNIETFVWSDLNNPVPLSRSQNITATINERGQN